MKQIQAYIKPHKTGDVARALRRVSGLSGMTVFDARGWGHGKMRAEGHHAEAGISDFEPHTKIEICCDDDVVEQAVEAIRKAAHTGLAGDGKVYVVNVESVVRISTGQRDEEAL